MNYRLPGEGDSIVTWSPGLLSWPLLGAASAVSIAFAGGLLARFFRAMVQDHLGILCRPAVREHLVELRIVGMETQEDFTEVGPGLDPVTLGSGENGEQNGGAWTGLLAAKEQPVLSANGLMPQCSFAHVVVDR